MTPFGTTADGQTVHALTLAAGNLTVTLLTYGAIVQSVRLAGVSHDLTVGSCHIADYETAMPYNGALIGPVANRLRGAQAPIDGQVHTFEANENARTALHSGQASTCRQHWHIADRGPDHATLTLTLPHGQGGYPGTRRITARFAVTAPGTLSMTVTATTDAPTLINFANHSYWNLDGTPTWAGHSLRIAADHYLPIDDDTLPTGEIRPVAGTPFDLRTGPVLTPGAPPLDHNFCLSDGPRPLRDVLWLTGTSGLTMTMATTQPGMQVFDGVKPVAPGAAPYRALAIEAQGWPDAPNNPQFPTITQHPDAPYRQQTQWRIARP